MFLEYTREECLKEEAPLLKKMINEMGGTQWFFMEARLLFGFFFNTIGYS